MSPCAFVPPYLLEAMAASPDDDDLAGYARDTLQADDSLRSQRERAESATGGDAAADGGRRTVSDAGNTDVLPGRVVREEGGGPKGDAAVDEGYDGMGAARQLFADAFGRDSLDDRGHPLHATVHYRRNYDNAFWDGERLVFGDGDGRVFERFTKAPDVIAHEFTHGVTQFTASLVYRGQAGSLNESMSDVFAALTVQRMLGQTTGDATWLIGEGLFVPPINADGLRSMKAPGTAYDDPRIGSDPQPATMSDFVDTTDDNGGVHINSGIPNRAFYLVASALGGHAWETAGPIWYAVLTDARLGSNADFSAFAALTLQVVTELHGADSAEHRAVAEAWATVEVEPAATGGGPGSTSPSASGQASGQVVIVRRSGGFAGMVTQGRLDTGSSPHGAEVEQLLADLDLAALAAHDDRPPHPDSFVFTITVGDRQVTLAERDLTPDLEQLVGIVLEQPGNGADLT